MGRTTPYLLILPSFLLAAGVVLWPLGEIVQLSLHDVNRFGMLREFIGLAHFRALFQRPGFHRRALAHAAVDSRRGARHASWSLCRSP